jgi:quercetin dioxygenase-like cupin family protein
MNYAHPVTASSRIVAVSATLLATVAIGSATAGATPPSGVSAVVLGRTTVGDTDYILREITVAPGGSTGWHYHDGTLYALIRRGTLRHFGSACAPDMAGGPGDIVVERAGRRNVHIERNLSTEPQVLDVLYVLPAGSPLAEDAANPGCPFN